MVCICLDCRQVIKTKQKKKHQNCRVVKVDLRTVPAGIMVSTQTQRIRNIKYAESIILKALADNGIISKPIQCPTQHLTRYIYVLAEDEFDDACSRLDLYQYIFENRLTSTCDCYYNDRCRILLLTDINFAFDNLLQIIQKDFKYIIHELAKSKFGMQLLKKLRERCKKENLLLTVIQQKLRR